MIRLGSTSAGSGPGLVCLHAFPMDSRMWEPQVACLAASFTLLTPDLPGFGQSRRHPGWRMDTVAEELLAIANRHGLDRFGVIGLSMGTYAAFEIVRRAPDRVSSLVLADGRAHADSPAEREGRTRLIAALDRKGGAALEEAILPRLVSDDSAPDFRHRVEAAVRGSSPPALADALEALRERRDSTDLLGEIRCPTLVLGGSRDPITPPAACREMAEAIPGARFAEVPDAGHLSNLENPVAFNRSVEGFLQRG